MSSRTPPRRVATDSRRTRWSPRSRASVPISATCRRGRAGGRCRPGRRGLDRRLFRHLRSDPAQEARALRVRARYAPRLLSFRPRRNSRMLAASDIALWKGYSMILPRRRFLRLAAAAAALARPLARSRRAQAYPSRPLRWVVGFPPGGGADIVSRIMAPWLAERLGQSVIVENKPGAGSNISVQAVVNAPPDGYTLLFVRGLRGGQRVALRQCFRSTCCGISRRSPG